MSKKIMIIDDSSSVRQSVGATLQGAGYDVIEATDGQDALNKLDGQPIDSWTDSRLPVGGIGFIGATDDRARIYWVRLSPLGGPGKEYSRR